MARMNKTPVPADPEKLERAQALAKINEELDRLMPQQYWFGSKPVYKCKQCGAAVFDRVTHMNFHKGEKFYETILLLFG